MLISIHREIEARLPVLEQMLGRPVTTTERLGGGRNSRVYRVYCGGPESYVAKIYPDDKSESAGRLEVEFGGLEFLRRNGIDKVPSPVAADKDQQCAIYRYVEGLPIESSQITLDDIGQLSEFLVILKGLNHAEGSRDLPNASDSSFSLRDNVANIQARLDMLLSLDVEGAPHSDLQDFLAADYQPTFSEIQRWCEDSIQIGDVGWTSGLALDERTLSPSDFGFHNALRRSGGEIVFLDFEYFGWDDPAKMIADFLLHPAMDLDEALKQCFVTNTLSGFRDYPHLAQRLETVYPLSGLKWCLLLLNEFVPERLQRRGFAISEPLDEAQVQTQQLAKAKNLLTRIISEYQDFPYRK